MLSIDEAARLLASEEAEAIGEAHFSAVATDSRSLPPGALFVALRGAHFDGHQFVAAAGAAGAAAALVERAWLAEQPSVELPLLVVNDSRHALGRLAAAWRARFELPLIGITGSNGKTTVKEMCAAILRVQAADQGGDAASVLATAGNFNNDIGLPLTLLQLRAQHRAAVIEMGMNRSGEIAYLSAIARPQVALVTNAQRAHLQGLGTVEEVVREKGAIFASLDREGTAVINADDPHASYWLHVNRHRHVRTFGVDQAADVRARFRPRGLGLELELLTAQGRIACYLHAPGAHNARNAAAAAAACLALGVDATTVGRGLEAFRAAPGRLQERRGPHGALIIDDSYNANPDSVRAAIDVLAAMPGETWLVLGDMGEVGERSAQLHDEVGGYAKSKGIGALYALGKQAAFAAHNFGAGGYLFNSHEALVKALRPRLEQNSVVLIKGSRFMQMEKVADALAAVHNAPPSTADGT